MRLALLTFITLACFGANSVLCRLALRDGAIDPASFTLIRLASGALVLALILRIRGGRSGGNWGSALALLGYAAGFSFAYVSIPAGTGALLLFGAVQTSMVGAGITSGERPSWNEWAGELVSIAGLIALLLPGVSAPPLLGAALMIAAGLSWTMFSLRGRSGGNPLGTMAGNFLRATPLAALLLLLSRPTIPHLDGLIYALLSGALASGIGYAIWYTVLPQLTKVRAGLIQLSVPIWVALIGIAFLGEPSSVRLWTCAAVILSGLALATLYRPAQSVSIAAAQTVPSSIRSAGGAHRP